MREHGRATADGHCERVGEGERASAGLGAAQSTRNSAHLQRLGALTEAAQVDVAVRAVPARTRQSARTSKRGREQAGSEGGTHPSIEMSLRLPPKYWAYSRAIGRPYPACGEARADRGGKVSQCSVAQRSSAKRSAPKPAMGALKSVPWKSWSRFSGLAVVYLQDCPSAASSRTRVRRRRGHAHPGPDERQRTARDTASLVRDLDRDVLHASQRISGVSLPSTDRPDGRPETRAPRCPLRR